MEAIGVRDSNVATLGSWEQMDTGFTKYGTTD